MRLPRLVLALWLVAGWQLAFVALAAVWQPEPRIGYLVAAPAVAAAVIGVGAVAPVLEKAKAGWILLPVAALVTLGLAGTGATSLAPLLAVTACLLCAGALGGALVGGHVAHPGHLLVVVYVSAIADLYSVLAPSGPTARIVQSETLLPLLAVSWPVPGLALATPLLGIGDVIVTALLIAAARRHGLGLARTVLALALAYGTVFTLVATTARAIPALPFLGTAFLLAHSPARRLLRTDRRPALIGMTAVTLLSWRWPCGDPTSHVPLRPHNCRENACVRA